ncbi:MAG: M24 family metallopeptidase, partial [Rubripirellula sp.]
MNIRIEKLLADLRQDHLDALLVTNEVNVRYLTGFTGDSTYLVVGGDGPILLSDGRYETQIATQCPGIQARIRSPSDLLPDLTREALLELGGQGTGKPRVGVEAQHLSLSSFRRLTSGLGSVEFIETSGIVEKLRMIKDADEIAITKKAVEVAQTAFLQVLPKVQGDWSELQLAFALEDAMRQLGAQGCSFDPIVGAGPGAALPHYQPTQNRIGGSNGLLIDWGALCEGYASDLTRTLKLKNSSEAFNRAHQVVLEAQMAAIEAIQPGRETREVDAAARRVLRREGMEDAFKHG